MGVEHLDRLTECDLRCVDTSDAILDTSKGGENPDDGRGAPCIHHQLQSVLQTLQPALKVTAHDPLHAQEVGGPGQEIWILELVEHPDGLLQGLLCILHPSLSNRDETDSRQGFRLLKLELTHARQRMSLIAWFRDETGRSRWDEDWGAGRCPDWCGVTRPPA